MEVLWMSGSPFAWRVLLAAELKGVSYTSTILKASDGEHKAPAYLAINPRGKVPSLRDGELIVTESIAILAYLDRKHPDPALFGRSPSEAGAIWSFVLDYEANAVNQMLSLVRPIFFGGLEEKMAEVNEASAALQLEISRLEKILANQEWLVGNALSAADISVFPTIKLIERAIGAPAAHVIDLPVLPLSETHPNISAWCGRICKLPGFEKTYPPHWKSAS